MSRGAIHELEILQARASVTNHLKNKEHARKSLSKGKSLTAIEALDMLLKKCQSKADNEFRKASRAITININKKKNTLKQREIQVYKDEREL